MNSSRDNPIDAYHAEVELDARGNICLDVHVANDESYHFRLPGGSQGSLVTIAQSAINAYQANLRELEKRLRLERQIHNPIMNSLGDGPAVSDQTNEPELHYGLEGNIRYLRGQLRWLESLPNKTSGQIERIELFKAQLGKALEKSKVTSSEIQ